MGKAVRDPESFGASRPQCVPRHPRSDSAHLEHKSQEPAHGCSPRQGSGSHCGNHPDARQPKNTHSGSLTRGPVPQLPAGVRRPRRMPRGQTPSPRRSDREQDTGSHTGCESIRVTRPDQAPPRAERGLVGAQGLGQGMADGNTVSSGLMESSGTGQNLWLHSPVNLP